MPSSSLCPEPAHLQQFLLGVLPEQDSVILEEHLSSCPACARTLHSLPGDDTFVEMVRARATASGKPTESIVHELTQRLKALRVNPLEATLVAPVGHESSSVASSRSSETTSEIHSFLSPPQAADELGRLGGYRILRVLGRGGMGVVFEAEDVGLERRVGVKVMQSAVGDDGRARLRFLSEARAAAKVHCDHVVTIFQVGEDQGVPFLAMELLHGESLDEQLKRSHRPSLQETLRIGREIALGLAAAHEQGLIHRDIKPGNVWVEPSGRAKILDFGLARPIERDAHLTSSGSIVGTPAYMAPEQARGEKVDGRADLFSLGCILYRLCTGSLPFQGDTAMDVLVSLATQTPPPVSELSPETPPALVSLIHRLLSKDREKRPASATEVVEAIKAIEERKTPTAERGTPASGGSPPRRRKWPLIAAAAAACIALIAAGVVFFWQSPNGLVRIEIDDDDIEVTLTKTGVKLKKADGEQDITLTAGADHRIKVTRGKDFSFETKEFVLKKGEKITVKVEVVDGKVVAFADGKQIGEKRLPEAPGVVPPPWGDYALRFEGEDPVEVSSLKMDRNQPFTLEGYLAINKSRSGILGFLPQLDLRIVNLKWTVSHRPRGGAPTGIHGEEKDVIRDRRTHVAAVYDSKNLTLFVDGKLVAQKEIKEGFTTGVGRFSIGAGDYWGLIDEVRVSRVARYAKDFTPARRFEPDADTLALYHFDEGKGDVLKDSSGNGHHGKIVGARWVNADGSPIAPVEQWVQLFNGRDLTGWADASGGVGEWKVVDGAMTCSGGQSHLYTDRDTFGDFHLRAEARINAQGNSGIYFRTGKPLQFIGDYEAQITNNPGQGYKTGSLYGLVQIKELLVPADTWFTYEIIAQGNRIRLLVNGKETADYSETRDNRRVKGHVALQHHDDVTQVHFRKVEIKELK